MKLTLSVEVDVDEETWAEEYGLSSDEVPHDVVGYLTSPDLRESLNDAGAFGPVAKVTRVKVARS